MNVKVEQEYQRAGALNLFAAFDTRSGQVWGQIHERKRQVEFIEFLEWLNQQILAQVTQLHVVLDNLQMHKGKQAHTAVTLPATGIPDKEPSWRGAGYTETGKSVLKPSRWGDLPA